MYAYHLNYFISMDTQNGLHACTQVFFSFSLSVSVIRLMSHRGQLLLSSCLSFSILILHNTLGDKATTYTKYRFLTKLADTK